MRFGNMKNISYLCNKKFMFTLYHIPDRKEWGCTKNLKARLKKSKYTLDDVYETLQVEDIDEAAYLERELNIMYGYGWNESQDYRRVTKIGLKGSKIGADIVRGTKFSEEHKNKISKSNTGRVFTQSHKLNIKENHKGRKAVSLIFNNNILNFDSMTDASKFLSVSIQAVYNCVNGKSKTVRGYKINKT